MSDVDLSRLPTGEMGWADLLAYVCEADDRIERYFLEVKSDVDLNTKQGRAKVAKFILGAANRDREQALRRFDGYAVMLIGVGGGGAAGIPSFEAKDLSRDVLRFIGVDGPRWDFDRIPAGGDLDVIAIVVEPPTGELWTCRADGAEGLQDGEIYVRADGETRKATGDEIRVMVKRAMTATALPIDVGVDLVGDVAAIRVDTLALVEAIEREGARLLAQIAPRKGGSDRLARAGFADTRSTLETRSREKFRAEVETWMQCAKSSPAHAVLSAMGHQQQGIRIRVTNHTRTFLRDVRVDIEIDGGTIAMPWKEPVSDGVIDLFPDRPLDWGDSMIHSFWATGSSVSSPAGSLSGLVEIRQRSPARLRLTMDSLRPADVFTTDDKDVVLVLMTDEALVDTVPGRWRITADGVNDVHKGTLAVTSTFTDMREPIAEILAHKWDGL